MGQPRPQHRLVDIAEAVPGGTLITIPAGHDDVHEAEPDAFATAVPAWLDA